MILRQRFIAAFLCAIVIVGSTVALAADVTNVADATNTAAPIARAASAQAEPENKTPVAEKKYVIELDGKEIELASREINLNGIAYLPMRSFAEKMGCKVSWDEKSNTMSISRASDGLTMRVTLGKLLVIAKERCFYMPAAPRFDNKVFYVPTKTIAKVFGLGWRLDTMSHFVTGTPLTPGSQYYNSKDLYWLSRIIYAESNAEPLKGKIAVGNVIYHRVESGSCPDTVYGVIFDRKYGVQFTPVATGAIYNTPSSDSVLAAKLAMEEIDVVPGAMYFFNPRTAGNNWISKNRPYVGQIGNHAFYK